MSVRDTQERQRTLAEIAEEEKAGVRPTRPYSGAGSFGGTTLKIGLPENAPTSAREKAAHAARRDFAFEVDELPAIKALAKAAALTTANILRDKKALTELLCCPKPLDQYFIEDLGQKDGCPLFREFLRGGDSAEDVFWNGPFQGFLNSEAFKPFRQNAIEKGVLDILLNFLQRNFCEVSEVRNWQRALVLFIEAHYALPYLQAKPAPPTAAERLQYTVGGKTLIGKAAIGAMPSTEFKRRLKEEPGFASLVEEVETGHPLSSAERAKAKDDPYSYNTTVVLRNFRGRDLTRRDIDNLSSSEYAEAMKLLGTPLKSLQQISEEDGYLLHGDAEQRQ